MSQTELIQAFAFSALETSGRAKQKGQNNLRSALPYSHLIGARIARQRCPVLQSGGRSINACQPLAKGTSLLCSTWGHFYFALTILY